MPIRHSGTRPSQRYAVLTPSAPRQGGPRGPLEGASLSPAALHWALAPRVHGQVRPAHLFVSAPVWSGSAPSRLPPAGGRSDHLRRPLRAALALARGQGAPRLYRRRPRRRESARADRRLRRRTTPRWRRSRAVMRRSPRRAHGLGPVTECRVSGQGETLEECAWLFDQRRSICGSPFGRPRAAERFPTRRAIPARRNRVDLILPPHAIRDGQPSSS